MTFAPTLPKDFPPDSESIIWRWSDGLFFQPRSILLPVRDIRLRTFKFFSNDYDEKVNYLTDKNY
jgi:hypothetical protein